MIERAVPLRRIAMRCRGTACRARGNQIAPHHRESGLRGLPFDVYIAFDLKWYAVFKSLEHRVDQLLDRSAAVIARHCLMQVPPDALDRVALRIVQGQEVQLNPMAPGHHVPCICRQSWKLAVSQIA